MANHKIGRIKVPKNSSTWDLYYREEDDSFAFKILNHRNSNDDLYWRTIREMEQLSSGENPYAEAMRLFKEWQGKDDSPETPINEVF